MKQSTLNHTAKRNAAIAVTAVFSVMSFAAVSGVCRADATTDCYYFSDSVNTGHDNGFSKKKEISSSDPHYGWDLGQFCVSDFTGKTEDEEGNPVFLKNVGDTVTLSFELFEDIDRLNDDSDLYICHDTNGYDSYFKTEKTDCGRGMLIVRKTDSQNGKGDPLIYTDYLSGIETGADTEVALFEEGDYEVALDYEIKEKRHLIGPIPWIPDYHNYRIFFRFSVRNGNCMAYPIELDTNRELMNDSVTEKGFSLDFVNSRYLDICIKYESVVFTDDGMITDVRFNRTAREGEEYTEEGLYTITVKNQYTSQTTVKEILVGSIWNEQDQADSCEIKEEKKTAGYKGFRSSKSTNQNTEKPNAWFFISVSSSLTSLCLIVVVICLLRKMHR